MTATNLHRNFTTRRRNARPAYVRLRISERFGLSHPDISSNLIRRAKKRMDESKDYFQAAAKLQRFTYSDFAKFREHHPLLCPRLLITAIDFQTLE